MQSNFSLQRAGGFAGFGLAATYVVGFGLLLGVLLPQGFDPSSTNVAANAAFVAGNRGMLYLWNLIIFVINSVFLVVLVLALHRRLRESETKGMVEIATAFGLIWSGFVLASGMITNVGMSVVADMFPTAPEVASQLFLAVATVGDGLGGGNEITGGLWVALVSWIAIRSGALPTPLAILGIVAGVAGLLTVVPPLQEIGGSIFGLTLIVWFAWTGAVLLRQPDGVARAS